MIILTDNGKIVGFMEHPKQDPIPGTLDGPGKLVLEAPKPDGEVHRPEYRKQFELGV